jgi:hypothetical protein
MKVFKGIAELEKDRIVQRRNKIFFFIGKVCLKRLGM